jgi:hypothetical protein
MAIRIDMLLDVALHEFGAEMDELMVDVLGVRAASPYQKRQTGQQGI